MYRVAKFERKQGKLEFVKFEKSGFYINNLGELYKGRKKVNTTDKRKSPFYVINKGIERKDLSGSQIYENDIVLSSSLKQTGVIKYLPKKGAFMFCIKNGVITSPYSFLDFYDVSLLVIGNVYEAEPKIYWKKY